MRVPVSWLREYVPLEMPLPELAMDKTIGPSVSICSTPAGL